MNIDYTDRIEKCETIPEVMDIIKGADRDVIAPVLRSLVKANYVQRSVLQGIYLAAEKYDFALFTEEDFNDDLDIALVELADPNATRATVYTHLHTLHVKFVDGASQQTYEKGITVIAMMIWLTDEASLDNIKKPFLQIGSSFLHRIDENLSDTSVMGLWESGQISVDYYEYDKNLKIGEYLEKYTQKTLSSD